MGHIPEGDRMQSRIMCLDDMVGKEAMVRVIDRFMSIVDLEELGFSNTLPRVLGRNSYSPLTLAKLYLFCYEEGIRSSRRIEKACRANIEVMWLVGGLVPDFKTIADFRRDNIKALTALFYEFVSFADSAGLFGKKLVAIDGTKIKASNSKKRNISKKSAERRITHHKAKVAQYLRAMDEEDDIDAALELADKADVAQRCVDEATTLLADMEKAGINEISLTDPDARCMGKGRQGMQVAYNVQAAVDAKCHLVVDIDITNRPDDHGQMSNMAMRTQEILRKRDTMFLGDKGYYGAGDLLVCKDANIDCIVAPQGKAGSAKGNNYTIDSFAYDAQTASYTCPKGACLACKSKPGAKNKIYTNKQACLSCIALDECKSAGFSYRRIKRRPENDVLDWADGRYHDNADTYKLRQQVVEHPFGTVKHTMGGKHFLLRGIEKVRCEAALLFLGYNLKRALSELGFDAMMAKLEEYATKIGVYSATLPSAAVLSRPFYGAIRALGSALATIGPTKHGHRCHALV